MKKCPNCFEELPDSAKYCFACGVILDSQTIKCPECSTENPKDAITCKQCGHTLSQEKQAASEPLVQWRFVNLLGEVCICYLRQLPEGIQNQSGAVY